MRARLLVPIAIAAALVAGVLWFYSNFERVPAKVWVGPSGEARLRQFLAAGRFAERMGLRTKELRSLPEIDALAPGGVLLLPNRRQALDARRVERILAWVQGGGHLIAEAEPQGVPDPLFDLLAVRRAAAAARSSPRAVELPGGVRSFKVALHGRLALEPPTGRLQLRAASGESIRLASFTRGKGLVSVATSLNFARNGLIGEADHAEFLWFLIQSTPAAELKVYVRPVRLSLWGFLTEHAAPVLIGAAALVLVWLWRIAPRFGPVAPDAPPARRRLLDHLRASGRYYWAQGLRERLVTAARDAALRRVVRAQPEFVAARGDERAARVASLVAISQEEAERLVSASGAMRGAAFIQVVQSAQRVHAALERGNR
jgi:hypothetical protein